MKRLFSTFLFLSIPTITFTTQTACVNKYNELVELDEKCNLAWGDVEVQYQRRMDLIPALLKTVKASATHEHSVLIEIEQAQAGVLKATQQIGENPTPDQMKAFEDSQNRLTMAIGGMAVVQEAYPQLKAPFETFMINLEGTENRISIARQQYNKAVNAYNTELRRVGGGQMVVLASTGQTFTKRELFHASAGAETAPTVEF